MKVGIASDHRGFDLKKKLLTTFIQSKIEMIDFGATFKDADDDYPDYVIPLARAVSKGSIDRGIAICGSGVGASIAANKIKNVRAALIQDLFSARQGVEDDNMNIICVGAQIVTFKFALDLIKTFLNSSFSGEIRHMRRLTKIAQLESLNE